MISASAVLAPWSSQVSRAVNLKYVTQINGQYVVMCKIKVDGDTMVISADQNDVGVISEEFSNFLVGLSSAYSYMVNSRDSRNSREPDKSLSLGKNVKDVVKLESITKLVIEGSITKIEANALRKFKSLEVVEILSNMKCIEESAFNGLRKLRSVKIDNGYKKSSIENNIERLLKDKEKLQKEMEEDEEQSIGDRTTVKIDFDIDSDNVNKYIGEYFDPHLANKIRECEESIKKNKEILEILKMQGECTLLYVSDYAFSDCCNLERFEVNNPVSFSKSAFCGCGEKLQSFNGRAFNKLKYHCDSFCRCSDHYYDEVYYRNYVLPHNLLLESRKK